MIELLIDWLNLQIKQSEHLILNGNFADMTKFSIKQAEYRTLISVRDRAKELAAGGGEDEE